jgi:RNA polymerase-interacting CarD/CdnL/TRCF family regulator
MILTIGNKVVYPSQGPCLISSVVEKVVADQPKSFYHLIVLDDHAGDLFVPIDKAQAIGVRLLLKKSDIPKLLGRLMTTTKLAKDWKQRFRDITNLFASGSAFDLAEVVGSLTELSETKTLSLRETVTLEKARKLLVREISEVMRETKSAAEEQIDHALKARKIVSVSGMPNSLPLRNLRQGV